MLTGCTPAHGYIKEPLGGMFQWLDLSRSRDVICWKKLNSLKLAAMENPMGQLDSVQYVTQSHSHIAWECATYHVN